MSRLSLKAILLLMLAASLAFPASAEGWELLASHPLDARLFTQGLELMDGRLMLSSGLYGSSLIGELNLETGRLTNSIALPDRLFAEGITATPEGIWLLSWQEGEARLLDRKSLRKMRLAHYEGEGWGLCFDGEKLCMSDGSSWLTFRDAESFAPLHQVQVLLDGQPVELLNELEYVDGAIYANVWTSDLILKIDPASGEVLTAIDLSALGALAFPPPLHRKEEAVLNGIAHIEGDRFYVTGKHWPRLFEVRLP